METGPRLKLLRQIDAVEIEDIKVANESVTIGQPITADDDWLKKISFRVKNVSDQKLISIQLTIVAPEMRIDPDMDVGSPQIIYCYGCENKEKEKGIAPGEEVELKMIADDEYYIWVKSRIAEKMTSGTVSVAEIHHFYVKIPNSPTWYSGCARTTNPKNACPVSVE